MMKILVMQSYKTLRNLQRIFEEQEGVNSNRELRLSESYELLVTPLGE